jgi:phage baseplate assembly protein W
MLESEERWGNDIRLLRNLSGQEERDRGFDLSTIVVDRPGVDTTDLELLSGLDNLRQALLLRFLTPVGEMAPLGHPDYGSKLFKLIGEPNTVRNRNRAKLYVLQALEQEPRVAEILQVNVTERPGDPTRIDIEVALRPIRSDSILNFVFPFFLDRRERS